MRKDAYKSLKKKLAALYGELVGERAARLDGSRCGMNAHEAIELALKKRFGPKKAWEIAFNLSDWGSDAAFIVAMHLFPERFTPDEIAEGVSGLVIHVPNHVAAAAHLHGWAITDVYSLGLYVDQLQESSRMPAGYSGTPLAKKLGFKAGIRVYVANAPDTYLPSLDPLPDGVEFLDKLEADLDLIHLFTDKAKDLAALLKRCIKKIKPNGMIWVSWPKKAAKVPTDITEDVIRKLALATVLVDVKVCAVDEVWSGLKLVIRVENRK